MAKGNKKTSKKKLKAVRKITADNKEAIRALVDVIYTFLPLTAHSNKTITVLKIFEESSVERYLNTELSKAQCLQNGFEELFRYHDKLPFIIFRKLVPHAISYRRFKRNPLKKGE